MNVYVAGIFGKVATDRCGCQDYQDAELVAHAWHLPSGPQHYGRPSAKAHCYKHANRQPDRSAAELQSDK